MKNITKILIIALVSLFALGIMMGTAEASHTFKKGGYKMKVTDKQYKKLKSSSSFVDQNHAGYTVCKKVGTKTWKYYQYKTVKESTWRDYYDKHGNYKGFNKYTHHNGYWSNLNANLVGSSCKTVKHYNSDGSYYVDEIRYEKWRFTKKNKYNVYMWVGKNRAVYGDNKLHVELWT